MPRREQPDGGERAADNDPRPWGFPREIAPQDTRRRDLAQGQKWWQGKAQ